MYICALKHDICCVSTNNESINNTGDVLVLHNQKKGDSNYEEPNRSS